MIPILYEAGTTEYKTNGLGRLKDAISCNVTEERNGTYELSMTYPISGIHYSDIAIDRIIYATPADGKSGQPFRIYKISRPMSGQVEISAEHISYLLSKAIVMPFTATSCYDAFAKLSSNIVGADGFTFSTDKAVTANFTLDQPMDCRSLLGGTSGSILDTYGTGEYEFDKFAVTLHLHRGVDNGVTIRYGKNLKDATRSTDMSNVYTGIVPYATVDDVTYTLSEKVVKSEHTGDFANPHYKVVDFSNRFGTDETPTEDKLRSYAETYVKNNEGWEISDNVSIEFAALWQTDEYKNMAIQRINLCDTIHVVYTDLGINVTAEVIKTDYDVLAERYNSIEVGNSSTNLSKTITDAIDDATGDIKAEVSALPSAIKKATEQITGGLGGYIVLKRNANGQPEELLIMDTDDVNTAVNVWRWNKGGLGHSHNGYDGPFDDVAITQDGAIVADYITTGTLNANLIKAGVITDLLGRFSLNMKTGALTMSEATLNNCHIVTTNGASVNISDGRIRFYDSSGNLVMQMVDGQIYFVGSNGYTYYTADSIGFYTSSGTIKAYLGRAKIQFGNKSSINNYAGEGLYMDQNGIAIGYNSDWGGCPVFRVAIGNSMNYVDVSLLRFMNGVGGSAVALSWWDNSVGSQHRGLLINDKCKIDGDAYANNWYYNSDRNIKQNITELDLDKASEFVLSLKPSEYQFIADPSKTHHGFIAQECTGYGEWNPTMNPDGTLSLAYGELLADMVATIQSQHKRITDLEERLAKIEEALNADN